MCGAAISAEVRLDGCYRGKWENSASVGSGRASWIEQGLCDSQRPLQQVGTLPPKDVTKSESTRERETNGRLSEPEPKTMGLFRCFLFECRHAWGYRDGSVVKSAGCSSREDSGSIPSTHTVADNHL